jgi:hypothetical protein
MSDRDAILLPARPLKPNRSTPFPFVDNIYQNQDRRTAFFQRHFATIGYWTNANRRIMHER